ncbi:hypothetical protein, partial [Burkholderia gladioli]|uniref:hypothetical protein n=1 Tax=Burkholderia gladioli TaxID=28095 RepID=UPI003C7E00E1
RIHDIARRIERKPFTQARRNRLDQSPDRVIPECIGRVIRIAQPDKPPESVIAVSQTLLEQINT